jgi:hypothetical protein
MLRFSSQRWTIDGPFGRHFVARAASLGPDDAARALSPRAAMRLLGAALLEPATRPLLLDVARDLPGASPEARSPASREALAYAQRRLEHAFELGVLVLVAQPTAPAAGAGTGIESPTTPAFPGLEPAQETTWIGFYLVDQHERLVPGRPYRIKLPDKSIQAGTLGPEGSVRVDGIDPGACSISCPYVEPGPARVHRVRRGEHLSGVAASYGFDDYAVVWNRPENAALRAARRHPHVLQPGDEIWIPERVDRPASRPTGAHHRFAVDASPLELRLRILDFKGRPIAGVSCALDAAPRATDGDGAVKAPVAKSAEQSSLLLRGVTRRLAVGDLDPVGADDGCTARLFNLGYLLDPLAVPGDDEARIAIEDFQADHGLPLTGELDAATRAKLEAAHGC